MPQTPWECDICSASDAIPCHCEVFEDGPGVYCDMCHYAITIAMEEEDLPLLPGDVA